MLELKGEKRFVQGHSAGEEFGPNSDAGLPGISLSSYPLLSLLLENLTSLSFCFPISERASKIYIREDVCAKFLTPTPWDASTGVVPLSRAPVLLPSFSGHM